MSAGSSSRACDPWYGSLASSRTQLPAAAHNRPTSRTCCRRNGFRTKAPALLVRVREGDDLDVHPVLARDREHLWQCPPAVVRREVEPAAVRQHGKHAEHVEPRVRAPTPRTRAPRARGRQPRDPPARTRSLRASRKRSSADTQRAATDTQPARRTAWCSRRSAGCRRWREPRGGLAGPERASSQRRSAGRR